MNAVLKYPGSKWRIADWINSKIPKHHSYLEPFFGSGAVFFTKNPSSIETVNDIDDNVVNLFSCIRDNPDELARKIILTPYSRKTYDLSFETSSEEPLEKARLFLIRCWQGHGFRTNGYKVGWKNDVQGRENMYAVYNWYRLPEWLIGIVDRLKQVQIENMPAVDLIKRFKYRNVFIYADPPYLLDTRTGKMYRHEMTEQDHVELLETLLDHPGTVMISGYESDLYDSMLKGWNKSSIKSNAEYYQGRSRTETIWMNYEPPEDQISLFEILGEKRC